MTEHQTTQTPKTIVLDVLGYHGVTEREKVAHDVIGALYGAGYQIIKAEVVASDV